MESNVNWKREREGKPGRRKNRTNVNINKGGGLP